jgi:hypothetical protein
MKLKELAAKPKLVKITLDAEELVAKYGEPIEFYIYDRQPVERFVKLATSMGDDYGQAIAIINDLLLDELGKPMLNKEEILPADVMAQVMSKVVDFLGK